MIGDILSVGRPAIWSADDVTVSAVEIEHRGTAEACLVGRQNGQTATLRSAVRRG
jgi:hypothetical protein